MSATDFASLPQQNVLVKIEDGIAWVSLNRPSKRNAINPGIVFEMVQVLDVLEADDSAKVVVMTGSGDAFSAGMDLKESVEAVGLAREPADLGCQHNPSRRRTTCVAWPASISIHQTSEPG